MLFPLGIRLNEYCYIRQARLSISMLGSVAQ